MESEQESAPKRGLKRGRRGTGLFRRLFLLAALGLLLYELLTLAANLEEVAGRYAEARITYLAGRAIHEAVSETLAEEGVTYESLVTLDTDGEGQITALRTDMALVNRLSIQVTRRVIEGIEALPSSELAIPLGNLLPSQLFSGRGPMLRVELLPMGSVGTRLEHVFEAAGINQTRHSLLLRVEAVVGALLPGTAAWTTVSTAVSVAETVIVGRVPNTYTYLEDTGLEGMDIYGDFDLTGEGAQLP